MTSLSRPQMALGAFAVLLLGAGATVARAAEAGEAEVVRRGQYLAVAGDCIACHTAPGGKSMAGGLPIRTPVGAIVSTNITPSKIYGIGNYTEAQFDDALRRGIRADGARLYPAMPYTSYARITDDDVKALYAYFMNGVAPVEAAAPPTSLPFPSISAFRWPPGICCSSTAQRSGRIPARAPSGTAAPISSAGSPIAAPATRHAIG